MNFLITAGGTREYIDPVRFISNASSGKMGYALAQAASDAGHKVTLITTVKKSELRNQNSKIKVVNVETAKEMVVAVRKFFTRCDCLIMAAAVSDYTPIKKSKIKIQKSNRNLIIKLKPTRDILKWAGEENKKLKVKNKKAKIVAGFALEDRAVRRNAEKKLKGKNLDIVIANTVAAIGVEKSTVQIKTANGRWMKVPTASKAAIAGKIVRLVEDLYCQQAGGE
jgi:phosphopantothenoylcysteine synthetase/decarboxylase